MDPCGFRFFFEVHMTDYLMIGEVLKPQGLKGECKIRPFASDITLFQSWETLYLKEKEAWLPVPFSCSRILRMASPSASPAAIMAL